MPKCQIVYYKMEGTAIPLIFVYVRSTGWSRCWRSLSGAYGANVLNWFGHGDWHKSYAQIKIHGI